MFNTHDFKKERKRSMTKDCKLNFKILSKKLSSSHELKGIALILIGVDMEWAGYELL